MAAIIYNSISELAIKIQSELSEDELRKLFQELIKDDIQKFSEYRDSIAYGNYAPISKVCPSCKRPI